MEKALYLARTPSVNELIGQCDACATRHRPTNSGCSMNWHRKSPASIFNAFYTKQFKRVNNVRIVGIESFENAPLQLYTLEIKK